MQKFLYRVLVFAGGVFIFYIIGLNLWDIIVPQPFKPNIHYKVGDGLVSMKAKESEKVENLDILFLGSSHAYVAFDPRIYDKAGLKTFNWGTTKQTHLQTRLVIDAYIKQFKPKLVIYEVFPEIFALDGIESTIDFLNSNRSFGQNIWDYIFKENGLKVLNTYIIKFTRQNIFNIDDSHKDNDKNFNLNYIEGGYVESGYKNSYNLTSEQRDQFLNIKWVPRAEQKEAFEENLKILKDNNIDFILVVAPYIFKYQNQDEIDQYLKEKGVYYDFNKILKLEESEDFSDFHHLNHNGAEKLNNQLIKFLPVISNKGM